MNPTSVSGLFSRERMELDGNETFSSLSLSLGNHSERGFIYFQRNNNDGRFLSGNQPFPFSNPEKKSREIRI